MDTFAANELHMYACVPVHVLVYLHSGRALALLCQGFGRAFCVDHVLWVWVYVSLLWQRL